MPTQRGDDEPKEQTQVRPVDPALAEVKFLTVAEVAALMRLFTRHLLAETAKLAEAGVRLSVIGRRDRLPPILAAAIPEAEERTAGGSALHLRLAVDYSARDAIRTGLLVPFSGALLPDVDLLIRTGGEQRLSDFLLWEAAYAELVFTDVMWPDYGAADLNDALAAFQSRERRFGALPEQAAG